MEWTSTFAERFDELTSSQTYQQISDFLGISKSLVCFYKKGQREPKRPALNWIAQKYGVSALWLAGADVPRYSPNAPFLSNTEDGPFTLPRMRRVPLVGDIACGKPILAEENVQDYLLMPENVDADFCLRCRGDSMINARIYDGDIVYVRQQETVENGEIAAVLVDTEATLKRVHLYDDHIVLAPENPMYKPLVYWGDEMTQVRILGKAVAFMGMVV